MFILKSKVRFFIFTPYPYTVIFVKVFKIRRWTHWHHTPTPMCQWGRWDTLALRIALFWMLKERSAWGKWSHLHLHGITDILRGSFSAIFPLPCFSPLPISTLTGARLQIRRTRRGQPAGHLPIQSSSKSNRQQSCLLLNSRGGSKGNGRLSWS